MLSRMAKIEQGLAQNGYEGAVVGFYWPSEHRPTAYTRISKTPRPSPILWSQTPSFPAQHVSRAQGAYLCAFHGGASGHLWVRALGNGVGPGSKWMVDQVCFASADMAAAAIERDNQTVLVMEYRSDRLTNYRSSEDGFLKWSCKINGGKDRLGRAGLPDDISHEHYDADWEPRYPRTAPDRLPPPHLMPQFER